MATAAAANESRSDLLGWINDLLKLNLTKIENIGTGAVLCQIMDSIYGDVQMHKVKFNTNQEYEYINNFKVLQACFTLHGIEKNIPVERLVKLKFQDNLEFLQWMKKFWDSNYPGGHYDAIARRKVPPPPQPMGSLESMPFTTAQRTATTPVAAAAVATTTNGGKTGYMILVKILVRNNNGSGNRPISCASLASPAPVFAPQQQQRNLVNLQSPPQTPTTSVSNLQHQITTLNKTITELRLSVDEMEKERDFYFTKLRDIEVETQRVTDPIVLNSTLYKKITEILYKTEEGFEIPTE